MFNFAFVNLFFRLGQFFQKSLLGMILVGISVGIIAPKPAHALTTEELKSTCTSEEFADQSLCFGYIEGVLDMLSVAPELQRKFQICIRGGVMSKGEFFDRISRYLQAQYTSSYEVPINAVQTVFESVQSIYPCTEDYFPPPVTVYETVPYQEPMQQQRNYYGSNSSQYIEQQGFSRVKTNVNPYLPPPPPEEDQ